MYPVCGSGSVLSGVMWSAVVCLNCVVLCRVV